MENKANPTLCVSVVYCQAPRQCQHVELTLPVSSTVADALRASGWLAADDAAGQPPALSVGIWGRKCAWDAVLHNGDRIELYRALTVDPKVARRERFRRQGARAAGLFSRRGPASAPPRSASD